MADDSGYNKRPIWQWLLIYLVIGAVIYAGIYFFLKNRNAGYSSGKTNSPVTNTSSSQKVMEKTVTIQNMAFEPATLTVKAGDSVTWINKDTVDHTATADDNTFDTGTLAQGQSKPVTFDKAGTFSYHCAIHPNMKATIIVQ